MISAKTAAGLFGSADAIGKRFRLGVEDSPPITVLGVAGDVRGNGLNLQPKFTIYLPYWQRDRLEMALAIRTAMDPQAITPAVRREIRRMDSELPVPQFRTMMEVMEASVAQRRLQVTILGVFGGLALMLASLGIYGVVSYSVAQRKMELGVRLALGAQPRDVRRLVLRQGMMPVMRGLAGGIAFGLLAESAIRSLLFGINSRDPMTMFSVIVLLTGVAALACWLPAARSSRIDPIQALRYE